MDEAQNLADRVAIMAAGRVVAAGTPDSLGGRDEGEAMISFRLPAGTPVADLPADLPGRPARHEDRVELRTTEPTRALNLLTSWALARGRSWTRSPWPGLPWRTSISSSPAPRSRPMPDRRPRGRPSDLALLWRQVRAQNKLFLRNPFSAFFSLAFPVMFLLLFGSLNGGGASRLGNIRYIQFLAPGMLAFAVISTCYTGLVTGVAINRDEGLLKRVRGTPLPPSVYITARILSAVWFSMVSAVVMVVAAVLLFRVEVIGRMLPAAAVTLLCGAACFCALGMAVAAVIPNEAAPVIANFTFFPIAFVSDLFFPTAGAPAWVGTVGSIFPVKHFAVALETTFNPLQHGSGFQWGHLGMLALWTVAGVVVAVRFFRWEHAPGRRAAVAAGPVAGAGSPRPTRRLAALARRTVAVRLADLVAGCRASPTWGSGCGQARRSVLRARHQVRPVARPARRRRPGGLLHRAAALRRLHRLRARDGRSCSATSSSSTRPRGGATPRTRGTCSRC